MPAQRRRGRPPSLSRQGVLVAASSMLLASAGAAFDRPELLGLGIVTAGVLFAVVIAQYPAAIFIWRRHVELTWRVARPAGDPTLHAGKALELTVQLRNWAPRNLGMATLEPIVSPALEVGPVQLAATAGREVQTMLVLTPRSVGLAMLHGASLRLTDAFGLTHIEAYFPSPIALPILPRTGSALGPGASPRAVGPERAQRASARLVGQGGDLRELRDHRPGDPWKQIAWKATARRGRIMVREVERETQTTHLYVLDVSSRMRLGPRGQTPLDLGIELTSRLARGALEAGDRAGVALVDAHLVGIVAPSDHSTQRRKIIDALAQCTAVHDEDRTDLSDSELCGTVARYLLLQEGEETRVPAPPVDDPRWSRLTAGPSGELYDVPKLVRAVEISRHKHRHLANLGVLPLPQAVDPQMAQLRRFCRERAIPLPVRSDAGRGARGLHSVLAGLRKQPPQRIVVISMLDGLPGVDDELGRPLEVVLRGEIAGLQRRGVRSTWVLPLVAQVALSPQVAEVLELELDRELQQARLLASRLGLGVQPCRDVSRFRLDLRVPRRKEAA
ncbi:MAG: DUF58 domain-containing protein [Polyangia bacterium]